MGTNLKQTADGGIALVDSATSAEVARMGGTYRGVLVAKVALGVADTAGGVLAWANPTGGSILVQRVILDVTTKATGACTLDVGVAANGTTLNDTLLDGVDVGTAAGVFDNIENQGINGVAAKKVTASQYVTASMATGAAAGLVGYAYVHYFPI